MLATEFSDVEISSNNFKYYKDLGYDVKKGSIINIPTKDLLHGSLNKVEVICDYCGEHIFKTYANYIVHRKIIPKDSCKKCSKYKRKETCLLKYGVESPQQLQEVKDKTKQTCLDKYGVENPMQVQEIKDKLKNTIIEKYGVNYYFETEDFKNKRLKYFENLSDEELNEIANKIRNTLFERYGVEHPLQLPEFKKKASQTFLKNGEFPTSNQQIEVYNMIKTLYGENSVLLNYPFDYYILDVALFINEIKIDVEYDGWYWHNEKRDNQRNNYLKHNYWKVLRVKSAHKLPTIEQLQEKLDILINTNEKYQEIVLDDWKENDSEIAI